MDDSISQNLSVTAIGRRNYFSLEMTPAGVSLRLDAAAVNTVAGPVVVRSLVLDVPGVVRSFDFQTGPRGLRSRLTILKSVEIELGLRTIGRMIQEAGTVVGAGPVEVEPDSGDSLILGGLILGVPWSCRALFSRGQSGEVVSMVEAPRIFGVCDISWNSVAHGVAEVFGRSDRIGGILRSSIKPLLAGLGFKIPLMNQAGLVSVSVRHDLLSLRFAAGTGLDGEFEPVALAKPLSSREPSSEPSEIFSLLTSGEFDQDSVVGFIEAGMASPVLWPEVLARALTLGHEHPQLVAPLLAAVIIGAENPGWLSPSDLYQTCRRLMSAAAAKGSRSEMGRCAALVAGVVDRFVPSDALALLDELRASGLEGREVLEALAITFDRLGRHQDASTTRLRALAMVPPEGADRSVRNMIDRMDANSFQPEADVWLSSLGALAGEARFGSASPVILRTAMILAATRGAMSPGRDARDGLKRILESSPGDAEVLDLLLALSREKHEVVEAVELFTKAAALASGVTRCELLLSAARAVHTRFGLRRRAVELLEAAVEADPGCAEASSMLDSLYAALSRHAERVGLASRRLDFSRDPLERAGLLDIMVAAALASGMHDKAALGIHELLRLDPANVEYLRLGEKVFAGCGDTDSLREVREALQDLTSEEVNSGIETALADGDIPAALDAVRSALGRTLQGTDRLELLLQGADLASLAGRHADAASFLVDASRLDPVAAMEAACRSWVSSTGSDPATRTSLIMELAGVANSPATAGPAAAILLGASEKIAVTSMEEARALLEVALILDPDNGAMVMALGAAYEALGMRAEADVLLGKA